MSNWSKKFAAESKRLTEKMRENRTMKILSSAVEVAEADTGADSLRNQAFECKADNPGSVIDWIAVRDALQAAEVDEIVTGHGKVRLYCDGGVVTAEAVPHE